MSTISDTMPDFSGYILNRQYHLQDLLGAGTYGVVYKALDTLASIPHPTYRAIKIMRKSSDRKFDDIQREITLHHAVSHHRGVVRLHDAFDDKRYVYVVMDFCEGGDLFSHICEKRTYEGNERLARTAFISLIDAVQACHDDGITHRDLKPENVLSSEDGSELYLADFGVSTLKRTVDDFGCGTGIYMSPECVGEMSGYEPYCPRKSDIWALGIILINMLTRRNLWSRADLTDERFALFVNEPDYLYRALPLSRAAVRLLRRTLSVDPSRRISLEKLRRRVETIDTFFRSAHEDEFDPPLRSIVGRRATPCPPFSPPEPAEERKSTTPHVQAEPHMASRSQHHHRRHRHDPHLLTPRPAHNEWLEESVDDQASVPSSSPPSSSAPVSHDDTIAPCFSIGSDEPSEDSATDSDPAVTPEGTSPVRRSAGPPAGKGLGLEWMDALQPEVCMALRALRVSDS